MRNATGGMILTDMAEVNLEMRAKPKYCVDGGIWLWGQNMF